MLARIFNLLKQIKYKQLRIKQQRCLLCNWPIQLKLCDDEMGIRCTRCGASAVSQSLAQVFKNNIPNNQTVSIYELSSTGPFVKYLQAGQHQITLSEFMDDIPTGEYRKGIICQDVQSLTFEDNAFDVCTSSEVFEHVEDDIKGFTEIFRVLKPNGKLIFTVPINLQQPTIERTQLVNGKRTHTLPAEYHTDKLRGSGKVFCYRNYGFDVVERLVKAGFKYCKIIEPAEDQLFGYGRPVLVAEK